MERIPQGLTPKEFLGEADGKHELKAAFESPVKMGLRGRSEAIASDFAGDGKHLWLLNCAIQSQYLLSPLPIFMLNLHAAG